MDENKHPEQPGQASMEELMLELHLDEPEAASMEDMLRKLQFDPQEQAPAEEQEPASVEELLRQLHAELDEPEKPEQQAPAPAPERTAAFQPVQPPAQAPRVPRVKGSVGAKQRRRLPSAVKALLYVFGVAVVSLALAAFAWYCALDVLALTKPDREVSITVEEGDSVADVTEKLYAQDLIDAKWLFRLYCTFAHAERKIDPGVYTLNNQFDYHALVNGMIGTAPTRDTVRITVPEGYECEQILRLLDEQGVCSYDELAECAANYAFDFSFLAGLPTGDPKRLEGYLFPDTYNFYVNEKPENVLKKFLNNFENRLTDDLLAQLDALNETLHERMLDAGFTEEEFEATRMDVRRIVILASIIERETAGADESPRIASVIYNRLCSQVYPCLQIDATIQYVLPERKQKLTESDLYFDSPYNTYLNPGLTPGPISNPGLDSLKAALAPEQTNYYFYALNTNGKHHFSETYYEHRAFLEGLE